VRSLYIAKETEIERADLPPAVLNGISTAYEGLKVNEAAKIEKDGVVTYEIEMEKKVDVVVDANGTVIRKAEEQDDEDEDEEEDED